MERKIIIEPKKKLTPEGTAIKDMVESKGWKVFKSALEKRLKELREARESKDLWSNPQYNDKRFTLDNINLLEIQILKDLIEWPDIILHNNTLIEQQTLESLEQQWYDDIREFEASL